MTSNYIPAWREPLLTLMCRCDMDLIWVGNCHQMTCNVNHKVSWNNSVPTSLYKRYVQMITYTTGVVLKIPVQCSCSETQQLYCSKGSVQLLHLAPQHENLWGQEVWFNAYLTLASVGGDILKKDTGRCTNWTGGWAGQRSSLEATEQRKFSLLCPKSNPHS